MTPSANSAGRRSRAHVVHLDLFAELRRRGASWAQIADLLAAAGVRGSKARSPRGGAGDLFARTAPPRTWSGVTKRNRPKRNAIRKTGRCRPAGRWRRRARSASNRTGSAMQQIATPRHAMQRTATTRNTEKAESALHKRAGLLNHQLQRGKISCPTATRPPSPRQRQRAPQERPPRRSSSPRPLRRSRGPTGPRSRRHPRPLKIRRRRPASIFLRIDVRHLRRCRRHRQIARCRHRRHALPDRQGARAADRDGIGRAPRGVRQ